jgi:T4 superinfection immunity protein
MHFLIFAIGLYFAPAIVAAMRHTQNATAILLLNIFFGWTVIGWFVMLLFALCSAPSYVYYYYRRG